MLCSFHTGHLGLTCILFTLEPTERVKVKDVKYGRCGVKHTLFNQSIIPYLTILDIFGIRVRRCNN